MKTITESSPTITPDWQWPLLMAFIRLPFLLAGSAIAILAYQTTGMPVGIAAGLAWSTLTLTIVNLFNLALLIWRSKAEDFDIKTMIGFQWRLLARDTISGIAWSLFLGVLLLSGVFAVVYLLHGPNGFAKLEGVFVGEADFSFSLPTWLALVSAVAFPLLNPFVEELHYRGYTQPRLTAAFNSLPAGIVFTAAGFGLQQMVFAITLPSALAYTVGFFLWGLGAGFVYHRQGRLVPLIIAHFISNLSFGVIPLIMSIQGR